jgi:two-component system, LytTR family, response regulator
MIASIGPTIAAGALRTLLVDDEPLARERMRMLLGRHDDVHVLAECRDGAEAVGVIGALEPDLVFLDVEMPTLDGFGVLQQLEGRLPTVVFVSGHDDYAVRAFETHAIDYLLKPVAAERVDRSLARIRARRAESAVTGVRGEPDLRGMLTHLHRTVTRPPATDRSPSRIAVKSDGQLVLLGIDEIEWVEASGNYVVVHARGQAWSMRETMKHMEELLDTGQFVRVHRRAIINVGQIRALEPWMHGEYIVLLHDGTRLTASRVYVGRLKAMIRR